MFDCMLGSRSCSNRFRLCLVHILFKRALQVEKSIVNRSFIEEGGHEIGVFVFVVVVLILVEVLLEHLRKSLKHVH